MPLQAGDALAQALHVGQQMAHLALDETGGLAHAGVLVDGLHGLHHEHEHIGRGEDDARLVGLLDDVPVMLVELGIDGFGRHEHDGRLVRLAGDQVFGGNVADVLADVIAQLADGSLALLRAARFADGLEGLEGELGVHHHLEIAVGHADEAIGPGAVGQGGLIVIGAGGQGVGDDGLHARLAEGAARLLVGENVLKGDHLAGEAGDVGLGLIDDGQPLGQFLQMPGGALGLFAQSRADAGGDIVQPLGEHARDMGVAGRGNLRLLAHLPGHLGQTALQLAGVAAGGLVLAGAAARGAPAHEQGEQEQQKSERAASQGRLAPGDGPLADDDCRRAEIHAAHSSAIRDVE